MAHVSVLAHRYAEALFRVASEKNVCAKVSTDLAQLVSLLSTEQSLREVYENPAYATPQRLELLKTLNQQISFTETTLHFLTLLVTRRRMGLLEEVREDFDHLFRTQQGIIQADVHVAAPIDDQIRNQLAAVVEKISGKKPELKIQVDPSLLGGVRLQMGNTILDASVKTKIERLRESMLESG